MSNAVSYAIRSVPKVYQEGAPAAQSLRSLHPDFQVLPDRANVDAAGRDAGYFSVVNVSAGHNPLERINEENAQRPISAYLPLSAEGYSGLSAGPQNVLSNECYRSKNQQRSNLSGHPMNVQKCSYGI